MKARPQLLLADDDPSVLHALDRILKAHADVRSATSGPAALELLEKEPVDLLMLDLDMPGMSGFEVMHRLKGSSKLGSIPIVVLSADKGSETEARVLDSGAADFLTKPFTPAQVLARVRAQLQLRRMQSAAGRMRKVQAQSGAPVVLIVDDDVHAIHALRVALAPLACRVRFAMNAAQALEAIQEELPDVVLLDVQLPGASGFDLCEILHGDPALQHVPLIIVTRFDDEASEARACELGAVDFISKSCGPAVLLARVRKTLRQKAESDALLSALNRYWRKVGESRTALMLDAASDAILSVDAEGKVVLINRAACGLLDLSLQTAIMQPVTQVFQGWTGPEDLLSRLLRPASGSMGHEDDETAPIFCLRRPGGAVTHIEPRIFRADDHGVTLTTVSMRDVTERENAARQLQEHIRLQAERDARTMMMSCVVHEIGNPLNAILGFAQLMLHDPGNPLHEPQLQRMTLLRHAGEQLKALMDDLRDASLLEQGRFKVSLKRVNLSEVVGAAIENVRAHARAAGIAIHWSPPVAPFIVQTDPRRFEQCLANLLSNAVKYNRPQGSIEIRLSQAEGHALVSVEDTGQGMSPQQVERLFKPFERLGQEGSDTPGTGLGLAISRMLMEALGGTLTAHSKQGVGSCFVLSLPTEWQGASEGNGQ